MSGSDAAPVAAPALPRRVAVAASGGRDSTALLHATARAARALGAEVHALHVHHGLVPSADAWLARLRAQCARWARAGLPVRFHATRLAGAPARGDSVEAWARRERYAALAAMAQAAGCGLVLLAHHRRDQAETLLLQALRGGGPDALASMPRVAERDGIVWARPWLDRPREAIEAYLVRHRLGWVDDDSNADDRYARNRLRRQVWPALLAAFPDAEPQLAAAARRAAEAAEALRADADAALRVAGDDGADDGGTRDGSADAAARTMPAATAGAARCAAVATETAAGATRPADAAHQGRADAALDVDAWSRLAAARRGPALRRWLQRTLTAPVPETLVRRLVRELPVAASVARWPAPGGQLRLHDGRLSFAANRALPGSARPAGPVAVAVSPATPDTAASPPRSALTLDLSAPGRYATAGWSGHLIVEPVPAGGIRAECLRAAELRPRRGGERFQLRPGTVPRGLKKQFQSQRVPPWDRDGPLVFSGGRLVFVAGLGLDARSLAPAGAPQLALRWEPDTGVDDDAGSAPAARGS